MSWLDARADSVRLAIRVTPGASRNAILGIAEAADGTQVLKISVTAVAERGKANKAVIALLAKEWRLAKSDFSVVCGPTARTKVLQISGSAKTLAATIRKAVSARENS